jgi:hypothetical protein
MKTILQVLAYLVLWPAGIICAYLVIGQQRWESMLAIIVSVICVGILVKYVAAGVIFIHWVIKKFFYREE